MICKKDKNLLNCNCTYDCDKKGLCCVCIAHHRVKNELPACYFSKNNEKTYNRSINNYLKNEKNNS
jgi:hypothetical protein